MLPTVLDGGTVTGHIAGTRSGGGRWGHVGEYPRRAALQHRPLPHRHPRAGLVPRPGFAAGALVPRPAIESTARAFRRTGEITVSLGATRILGVSSGGRSMIIRLMEDRFGAYGPALTGTPSSVAEIPVAPLLKAIKRADLVCEPGTPVRLALTAGELRVRGGVDLPGQASESLPVRRSGDDIDIAFEPEHLLDGLAGITTGFARLELTGPGKPALLTEIPGEGGPQETGTGFRYLVTPVLGPMLVNY